VCSKTRRHARREHLTKRSEVSWSATAECGGGCCQGQTKKYYPKRSAGVEIFLGCLYTLAAMFLRNKGSD